jgi:hypothetical protein
MRPHARPSTPPPTPTPLRSIFLRYPPGLDASTIYASPAFNMGPEAIQPRLPVNFTMPWTPFPYKCDICTNDTHYM